MSSPYDQQIEDALAAYRDAREQAAETRTRIGEVEATATAPRRSVKVTVGAQGQVKKLDFPTHAYRTMAPKELAKVIVTTLEQARADALRKVMEVGIGPLPHGLTPADLAGGKVDPRAVLPEELELPDVVREYIEHGLAGGREREHE